MTTKPFGMAPQPLKFETYQIFSNHRGHREHRGRPTTSGDEIKDSVISYEKFLDDFQTIQDALGISLFQDPSDVDYADGDYISRFPSPWYRTFEKEGEIGTYIEYFH